MNVRLCQTSCTNFSWRFIGSIHVLQRRFVLQMKEQSLFYLSKPASSVPDQLLEKVPTAHNNRPTRKMPKVSFFPLPSPKFQPGFPGAVNISLYQFIFATRIYIYIPNQLDPANVLHRTSTFDSHVTETILRFEKKVEILF